MLSSLALLVLTLTSTTTASPLLKRAPAFLLRPGESDLCLGLSQGTQPGDGQALYNVPCNSTFTGWEIVKGDNQVVRLSGTGFCLDAGINPFDGGPTKLWTCLPGVPQQRWYYTDDNHIAITGGTVCVDSAGGGCGLGGCAPGTKLCGPSRIRGQVWNASPVGTTNPPPTNPPPTNPPPTNPTGKAQLISPNGNRDLCWTVLSRAASDGTLVGIGPCDKTSTRFSNNQFWEINRGDGKIKLFGTNYCLDAGSSPGNGIELKVWTCYDGLPQQRWYYTDDNHIAITGGTQCADLRKEDGRTLQTWACSGSDTQQVFTVGPTYF